MEPIVLTNRINPDLNLLPYPSSHGDHVDPSNNGALSRTKRGVASQTELWPQSSTLRISLMGMTQDQEKFTKDNINKWAPHVNLKFEFTNRNDGDIRVGVDNGSIGGYSWIGTEAKKTRCSWRADNECRP